MMKQKILFALLLLFPFSVLAEWGENLPQITGISYGDTFSSQSIININGTNLESCTELLINGKKISYTWKTGSTFSYNFSTSNEYSGTITLVCSGMKIDKIFSIPHISKVTGFVTEKFNREITLSWEWFGLSPTVNVEGGTFTIISSNQNAIHGTISEEITQPKISVTSDGLKSNTVDLEIKLPKITFITSPSWFEKGKEISIYGENFFTYNDTKIKIWENYYTSFQSDKAKKIIRFILPDSTGKKDIQVYSNGFLSPKISFTSLGGRPEISKVSLSETNNSQKIIVTGEKFWMDSSQVKAFLNYNSVNITNLTSTQFELNSVTLKPGNNIFEVEVSGNKSKIFNFSRSESKTPELNNFSLVSTTAIQRNFVLYLTNFVPSSDKILLNNAIISTSSCTPFNCTISVPISQLKGEFSVSRNGVVSTKKMSFNLEYDSKPYISEIIFDKNPSKWIGYFIKWENFWWSTLNFSNMASKTASWVVEYDISSRWIRANLPIDFNPEQVSSVTITSNGLSSTFQFQASKTPSQTRYVWAPILAEMKNPLQENIYYPGAKIEIIGKWLQTWDKVTISWKQSFLVVESWKNPYFIVPTWISLWLQKVFVENSDGQKSNELDIIFVDNKASSLLSFEYGSIKNKVFSNDDSTTLQQELYAINYTNKQEDLLIKKMVFKIQNYSSSANIGTFSLKIWGNSYGELTIPNDKWEIIFTDVPLEKIDGSSSISLMKKSFFINAGDFDISFIPQDLVLIKQKDSFAVENYQLWNFISHKILLTSIWKNNCIDSETSNVNCNAFLAGNQIKTPAELTQNTPETPVVVPGTTSSSDSGTFKLKSYAFKNKSFQKLSLQFWKILENSNKKDVVWPAMNTVLSDLYLYEKSSKNKTTKKLALTKLKKDIVYLKSVLK